jgi:hypothetical protein
MNTKEARAKVTERLSAGEKKQQVFAELSGNGVKDRVLAYLIASHVDLRRCAENKTHRRIVIASAYLQVVLVVLAALYSATSMSVAVGLVIGATGLLFGTLFVWGFSTNKTSAYSVFIILSLSQLPRQLGGFMESPVASAVGLAIGLGLIAYVWFVRQRLFPDFAFLDARKVAGQYVFSD